MHQNLPLSGFHMLGERAVADVDVNLVPVAGGPVIIPELFDFYDGEVANHAATDGGFGEGVFLIVERSAIVFVESVAGLAVGSHVAGDGQRVSGNLAGVLHERPGDEDAVVAPQPGPAIKRCFDLCPAAAGIFLVVPVAVPETGWQV